VGESTFDDPREIIPLKFCRLLRVFGDSKRQIFSKAVHCDHRPGGIAVKPGIQGDNSIGLVVLEERKLWVPVFMSSVKINR